MEYNKLIKNDKKIQRDRKLYNPFSTRDTPDESSWLRNKVMQRNLQIIKFLKVRDYTVLRGLTMKKMKCKEEQNRTKIF